MDGYTIYINEASGGVSEIGRSALEDMILQSGLSVCQIVFSGADDLMRKIQTSDVNGPIIIGGGDGTIKTCAEYLRSKNVAFGILPLGTMNLLAKDLSIPNKIEECLSAYAKGVHEVNVDVGQVNGHSFLCCAGLGAMPEASRFREQQRGISKPVLIPRLMAYVMSQMDRMNHKKLKLIVDGRKMTIKTAMLVVSNNQYGLQGQWGEENFKRASLSDGVLGVYSLTPYSFWDKVRILFRLHLGDWKRDEILKEWSCEDLHVETKNTEVLLSLDGEAQEIQTPLKFSIIRKGVKILVPEHGAGHE